MEASPRDIVYVLDADDAGAGGKDPTQLAGSYLPPHHAHHALLLQFFQLALLGTASRQTWYRSPDLSCS